MYIRPLKDSPHGFYDAWALHCCRCDAVNPWRVHTLQEFTAWVLHWSTSDAVNPRGV